MNRFAAQYRDFFRQPDVTSLVAVALLARMPIGMIGLSMLMFLREAFGTFALAGSAVGIYFVAMAIAAPIQGRLIDRVGPRMPLIVTGIVQPLAMIAMVVFVKAGLGYAFVATAAGVAGAFQAPITVLTRTLWRYRFTSEADRRRAFAIDAVMIEINFTLGPAIIALVLAVAHPTAAYLLAIVASVCAFALFMASPALKYFRREPHADRHMLGPLTEPRLLAVFVATFGLTTGFGLMEVGYPGFATALALPALGGVLLSVNSLGSAIGGGIFGGMNLRASVERQFAATLGLMAIPLFLHAAVDGPVAFGFVAFIAGFLIAPSITSQSVLVTRLAPSHYATEAFTWSSTFIVTGLGAGMALGGLLVETAGPKSPFVAAGAIVAAMSLLALLIPVSPVPRPQAAD
jgi:MFS family permease